ncbi:iron ABC transporter permease [Breoghania sp.]|uniref:FecCD family ABC transporter permease n=1 Tax=Breoghania sp. TaxID=2065378 RepID=UPI0029CA6195|nr:iron ABC transporter permease [Breoghania sp.]
MAVHTSTSTALLYRRAQGKRLAVMLVAVIALGLTVLVDIAIGPSSIRLGDVWQVLLHPGDHAGTALYAIVIDIRLPMTLTALSVGASLGLAGVEMQTILRNPLASPYTLGISAAAGFGAAMAILTGFSLPFVAWLGVPLLAFVTALAACMGVWLIGKARGVSTDVLVLSGIAMLFLFQSLQSLVQYMASPEVLQEIVFWLFGSLLKANWTSTFVTSGVFLAVVPLLAKDAWKLTALTMGDQTALSLGLKVGAIRLRLLILISVLTGSAVAFTGTIGFIGLVAPHMARGFVGEDQRFLMPLSAFAGAFLLVGSSVVAKLMSPGAIIPIGIVTAVLGVPFLFFLILRNRRM